LNKEKDNSKKQKLAILTKKSKNFFKKFLTITKFIRFVNRFLRNFIKKIFSNRIDNYGALAYNKSEKISAVCVWRHIYYHRIYKG